MTDEAAGMGEKRAGSGDPGTADILSFYVDRYMAVLGPYVSSVFIILLLKSDAGRRKRGLIRSRGLSINEIADAAGISKRKTIDALKVLRGRWMIVQRKGRGRGNKNHYYFLPVERWSNPSFVEKR